MDQFFTLKTLEIIGVSALNQLNIWGLQTLIQIQKFTMKIIMIR